MPRPFGFPDRRSHRDRATAGARLIVAVIFLAAISLCELGIGGIFQVLQFGPENREVVEVCGVQREQQIYRRICPVSVRRRALSDDIGTVDYLAYQALGLCQPFLRRYTALALYPARLLCGEAGAL
jgi:hypothetical protein